MTRRAEEIADVIEVCFINENVDEVSLPMFDFEININDGE